MLIIIEEMRRNTVFTQKIVHGTVGVQVAEHIQIRNRFDGYIPADTFLAHLVYGRKLQRIVFAAEAAGIKEVVAFFHNQSLKPGRFSKPTGFDTCTIYSPT